MTVTEAISCCDSLINFMERKSFTNEQEIMQMYRLKEKFEKERHSKSKRTTLTDLFKRAVVSSTPSLSADSVTRNPDNK
jgi:ABC-type transport system involved in Fe-S cluster assembly fused permease/ATPase subunit